MENNQKLFFPSDGPFTLFAPTDEAFEKFAGKDIGKKEATQIVNKHLVRILQNKYHCGLKSICHVSLMILCVSR